MDRVWLLTWTTYGTWLPGDERGHVSNVRVSDGPERRHNALGTEPDAKKRGLMIAARSKLVGEPIYLTHDQAVLLHAQFLETAAYRGWTALAVGVMANHVHVVVGVPGDPEPDVLLRDFKSYGSRPLNKRYGKPAGGTWWTEGGSKRKKVGDEDVRSAIEYVRGQEFPLLIWINEAFLESLNARNGEQGEKGDKGERGRKPPDSRGSSIREGERGA